MNTYKYFDLPENSRHQQYEAIRAFIYERKSAKEVAERFGYKISTVYSLARDFKKKIDDNELDAYLFAKEKLGRSPKQNAEELKGKIISLRKQYLSVEDIKEHLDGKGEQASETYIYQTIKRAGFSRLPKRSQLAKIDIQSELKFEAPKATQLTGESETFNSSSVGILSFLPLIKSYEIDQLVMQSKYPETKTLSKLNSILSFVALKLSNMKRYTKDDLWCMDRGLGLFAGLNVLPKAAWLTSYSHRVTRETNIDFLRSLNKLWNKHGLLSETANLDFTTIPCWGDNAHLENNWSGKRHHSLSSILAAVSQDPDSGLITYGDADVKHNTESNTVLEFMDFYKANGSQLKYLVFDSKFTTYQNLKKINDNGVKFITIRRRGVKIVEQLNALPSTSWRKLRVMAGDGKKRLIKVFEKNISLQGYEAEVRQIAITGHGKIKPALIITNDFDLSCEEIVRKYARRWIVEKSISEQTHFFHLNRLSSSMVIKVDFDLTMTILAYNLYRLLARELSRYSNQTAEKLYEKFIRNSGKVEITASEITVQMKKKRHLPAILDAMKSFNHNSDWGGKKINIEAASNC